MTEQEKDDLKRCIKMELENKSIEQSSWYAVHTAIEIIISALDTIDLNGENND